jgi:hypothetical protein
MAKEYRRKRDNNLLYLPGMGLVREGTVLPEEIALRADVRPLVEAVEVVPAPVAKPKVAPAKPAPVLKKQAVQPVAKPAAKKPAPAPAPAKPVAKKTAPAKPAPKKEPAKPVAKKAAKPAVKAASKKAFPIAKYDSMNVSNAVSAVEKLASVADVDRVRKHERKNKNRVSVLRALTQAKVRLSE